ncbi:EI24 domain-containing protein [Streptomyces sp. 4N509B]|uniref:EI24 domain-containing protein n=1 Tax=Streptomyces sp. 4N509B TaxID=3457413 RepID=UPI003FD011CD
MRDFALGIRLLLAGQRWVLTRRRWFGFGLLPALITLLLYGAALVALAWTVGDLAAWATPFADDWDETWRSALRTLLAVMIFGGGLLLAVLTFTAVTLLLGEPFYERLSEQVEEEAGGCPRAPERPWWRELATSLRDNLHLLGRVLAITVPLFVLGFVPLVGQTVVPVLAVLVSGFFLTTELTSFAMERRAVGIRQRLRLLRARTGLALGFGVPLVLSFLVPLGAVLLMPGAVAGATLLARELAGAETAVGGVPGGVTAPAATPWRPR